MAKLTFYVLFVYYRIYMYHLYMPVKHGMFRTPLRWEITPFMLHAYESVRPWCIRVSTSLACFKKVSGLDITFCYDLWLDFYFQIQTWTMIHFNVFTVHWCTVHFWNVSVTCAYDMPDRHWNSNGGIWTMSRGFGVFQSSISISSPRMQLPLVTS